MLIETLSTQFAKALPINSQSSSFTLQQVSPTGPAAQPYVFGSSLVYGFDMGAGGSLASNRLMLLPFCEGSAGSTFSVRVWGWRDVQPVGNDPNRTTWIPYPILEILCSASNLTGLPNQGGGPNRYLADSEHLCDSITLTYGNLGRTGFVSSAASPGTDLTAFVVVEMSGCRKFSFDFANVSAAAMNTMFSFC